MKKIISILFMVIITPVILLSQDINVQNLIGKKKAEVIKKYGTPVYQDNSNPSMVCIFYKSSSHSMTFVADKEGVYQAEALVSYTNEPDARSAVNKFISGSITSGFTADTVSVKEFRLQKPGVKVELQMSENTQLKKFEVKVKAVKHGSLS